MPKKCEISLEEVAEIWQMKAAGKLVPDIAAELGHSVSAVYKVIKKANNYDKKPYPGGQDVHRSKMIVG